MAERPDSFDVKELQSAVNDSATRVSAIWVSFLIFALYLLVAATTVTQRQLLIAEPIKLPVLNIELPLWGFFFLAPILFVILHIYTLLQVLLLGRTTAAYNDAVARFELSPEENISLRQRLANTLFAQIFAGSPREREGSIGWLMRAIVWITLAIAPILVVLAFQFSFLPYHSHFATWTHRLLILLELLAFFLIWPLALDARRNFQWPKVWANVKRLTLIPLQLFGPKEIRDDARLWVREHAIPLLACILYLLIPLSLATFPGEPHLNLFSGEALTSVQCGRWLQQNFDFADLQFDRLVLPYVDIVNHEKLEKMEEAARKNGGRPSEGERTYILRNRDLNCSLLSDAELRRADLSKSTLRGANFFRARLQGANLSEAQLQDAFLVAAWLQGADLSKAQLQGAVLVTSQLQGANLFAAQLQGADLQPALLQGANLMASQLQGANLSKARLQGAVLFDTRLEGANLSEAQLQGADLSEAHVQGADFELAQLQGADLTRADLDHSVLAKVWIWRARNAACTNGRVADVRTNNVIDESDVPVSATANAIAQFIERLTAEIPARDDRAHAAQRMREGLVIDPAKDDTEAIAQEWSNCEKAEVSTMPQGRFDEQRATGLRDLVCDASENRMAIADGIIRNWVVSDGEQPVGHPWSGITRRTSKRYPSVLSVQLARGLLGEDGKKCAATKDFDNSTIGTLKKAAAAKVIPAKTPEK
jgi:uncharacterized protein YjbI with pentapeptide repeats